MRFHPVIIIGAGPAGLCAARILSEFGITPLLIDRGKPMAQRNHADPVDCLHGEGGAGLFSDGKFSALPAGEKLMQQCGKSVESYLDAYSRIAELIKCVTGTDALPNIAEDYWFDNIADPFDAGCREWKLKRYQSTYLTLPQRRTLAESCSKCAICEWEREVVDVQRLGDNLFSIVTRDAASAGNPAATLSFTASQVIVCGGRFAWSPPACALKFSRGSSFAGWFEFVRSDIGVRVIGPDAVMSPLLGDEVDPKYIKNLGDDSEVRTFCVCRRGECVLTNNAGLRSWSGRADVEPTSETSFGFLRRFLTEFRHDAEFRIEEPFEVPLEHYLQHNNVLSTQLDAFLQERAAATGVTVDKSQLRVVGPTCEGTGVYPDLYKLEWLCLPGCYMAGDCTGIFRGIVPAMISGGMVAHSIAEKLLLRGKLALTERVKADWVMPPPEARAFAGKGEHGVLFEIHIFLQPLDPDAETIARAVADTRLAPMYQPDYPMKMCDLTLMFRGSCQPTLVPVRVLQSARYFRTNSFGEALQAAWDDARHFRNKGWDILRVKIEVSAHTASRGVPLDVPGWSYFETHIKVVRNDGTPADNVDALTACCARLSAKLGCPLPLSWNNLKNSVNGGLQRFVNVRIRNTTLSEYEARVKEICAALTAESDGFRVVERHPEYIVFDTNVAVDKGWID